jgi:hypothetical protein
MNTKNWNVQPPMSPLPNALAITCPLVPTINMRLSGNQFRDVFSKGVRLLLARRGHTDPKEIDLILAAASVRVEASESPTLAEMAKIVRSEVLRFAPEERMQPAWVASPRLEFVRSLVKALPDKHVAALQDYYIDGSDVHSACLRHGIGREEFDALRKSLRTIPTHIN